MLFMRILIVKNPFLSVHLLSIEKYIFQFFQSFSLQINKNDARSHMQNKKYPI